MSQLIPDNTFLSSNNNDNDDIYNNSWMPSRLALEGVFELEDNDFGIIDARYSTGSTIALIEAFYNILYGNITFFSIFEENEMTIYLTGNSEATENGIVNYAIESNVDNTITLDSTKIYSLSYEVLASYFNSAFTISDFNIKVELLPTSSFLDAISFTFISSDFNQNHVVENTIFNPPSGEYQLRFIFTLSNAFSNGSQSCRQKFVIDNASLVEDTSFIGTPSITDIEGNSAESLNFNQEVLEASENPADNLEDVSFFYPSGWIRFGVSLKLDTLRVGHNAHPTKGPDDLGADSNGNYNLVEFLKNHMYANQEDELPIFYNGADGPDNFFSNIIIVKNNGGSVYLPEFDFNAIGNVVQFEGFQMKLSSSIYLKYTGEIIPIVTYTYYSTNGFQNDNELLQGWNHVSFPSITEIDAEEYFAPLSNAGILVTVKDNLGAAYIPEFNFNGIGNLLPGQGYQILLQ
tara:strand:- start:2207 stop:3592 length:1386 start_codon:yes stop_codon:yes gene_type:complete